MIKRLIIVIALLLLPVILTVALYVHNSKQLEHQNQRNQYLENEIRLVDKVIREVVDLDKIKSQILARLEIISALDQGKSDMLKVMQVIARVPEELKLYQLNSTGKNYALVGIATDSQDVAIYFKTLQDSEILGSNKLEKLTISDEEAIKLQQKYIFRITGNVVSD